MSKPAEVIRAWRWPALAAACVILAGAAIAALQPQGGSGYLDPNGTGQDGGHALADLASARGQRVQRASVPLSDNSVPGAGQPAGARAVELVTSPGRLSLAGLDQAARFDGDIILVGPDAQSLRAIAPRVRISGTAAMPDSVASPGCTARPAVLAGDAYLGGTVMRTDYPAAQQCYPIGHEYGLIQYADGGRTISVLGTGAPLTNRYLADRGDAALALNLLGRADRVVWVVPSGPPRALAGPSTDSQRSFFSLVPWPAYLIAIQLGIAVLLAAAWRARRLGPLVAERLPVVVRASETVEGHGRLYQARRARDRAAAELRAATAARIARLTGTAATPEVIAARTGQGPAEVARLLYGPAPATDPELVTLAADLDTLERKIRQS